MSFEQFATLAIMGFSAITAFRVLVKLDTMRAR